MAQSIKCQIKLSLIHINRVETIPTFPHAIPSTHSATYAKFSRLSPYLLGYSLIDGSLTSIDRMRISHHVRRYGFDFKPITTH